MPDFIIYLLIGFSLSFLYLYSVKKGYITPSDGDFDFACAIVVMWPVLLCLLVACLVIFIAISPVVVFYFLLNDREE